MTIKVGAVTVAYDATITFVGRDDDARKVTLGVVGKERRDGGRVNADDVATLSGDDRETTAVWRRASSLCRLMSRPRRTSAAG